MSMYTINSKNMLFVFIVTLHFSLRLILICYKYKHISSLANVAYPVHGPGEHGIATRYGLHGLGIEA